MKATLEQRELALSLLDKVPEENFWAGARLYKFEKEFTSVRFHYDVWYGVFNKPFFAKYGYNNGLTGNSLETLVKWALRKKFGFKWAELSH